MPLPMVPAPRIAIRFKSDIKEFQTTSQCSSLRRVCELWARRSGNDGNQQHGYVVVTAVAICSRDELFARFSEYVSRLRFWDRSQNLHNLFVADLMGQPVGGEHVDVIRLWAVALNLRLYRGLRTDRTGDEVAHRRSCRLGHGDLTCAQLLFHQRVIDS